MDEESQNVSLPPRQDLLYPGLQRLLVAAVTDPRLAALLVGDPAKLVERERERFPLRPDEQALLLSVAGSDIYEISNQLYKHIQQRLSERAVHQEHTLPEDDGPEADQDPRR
jgi:hypothetical protein